MRAEAADQWMAAGERAMSQGATVEAQAFFDRALAETEADDFDRRWRALAGREEVLNLRQEREAQRHDLQALLALAEAWDDDRRRAEVFLREARLAGRLDHFEEQMHASEAAAAVALRLADPALELRALSRQIPAAVRLNRWDAARKLVQEVAAKLPAVEDESVRSQAAAALSVYYADVGDTARALILSNQAAEVGRRGSHRSNRARQLRNVGLNSAQLGLYPEAIALHREALATAEAIGDRNIQVTNRFDLSYVYWCAGERERGREIGERLLAELRETKSDPLSVANCLGNLGLVLEEAGELTTAASFLAEAHALYAAHSIEGAWTEVEAVEARAVLRLGRREEAQRLALEVWAQLQKQGAIRLDYPSRVYLCIADVFAEVETPGVSERDPLEAGYELLVRRSEMIENPEWRRSFLENEVTNRALLARWRALGGSG